MRQRHKIKRVKEQISTDRWLSKTRKQPDDIGLPEGIPKSTPEHLEYSTYLVKNIEKSNFHDTQKSDFSFVEQGIQNVTNEQLKSSKYVLKLNSQRKKKKSNAEKELQKERKVQRKMTTMISVIVGAFVICWAPFAVMFMLFPTYQIENESIIDLITWIGYINSSLNPIIYAIMNPGIKKVFSRMQKKILGKDESRSSSRKSSKIISDE